MKNYLKDEIDVLTDGEENVYCQKSGLTIVPP
jgi:hypothetical protein